MAEIARVAVGEIHIKGKAEEVNEQVSGICELWYALLTERLSGFKSIDILDREHLSTLLKELELSLTNLSDPNSKIRVQKLLGVDYLVLSELLADKPTYILSSRLVSVKDGSIERDFNIRIDVNNICKQANNIAAEIRESAINYFDRSKITHLIAIADFENKSPLSRNDWMETSVPRKLQRALKRLPCVRILEREEVDLLLKEDRLSKGGFSQQEKNTVSKNKNYKKQIFVTGAYDEYQPVGQKLHLNFSIRFHDFDSQSYSTFHTNFTLSEFDTGLRNIKDYIVGQISKTNTRIKEHEISRFDKSYNEHEAKVNLNKAIGLMGFSSIEDLHRLGYKTLWSIRPYEYFSSTRHPGDRGPARHANISRAVRYLKTAIMLDDNNIDAKELLCVLLIDGQISDLTLAKELAQEVAARYPDSSHEQAALLFLIKLLNIVEGQRYFHLLIEKYPASYAAQSAISKTTLSLVSQKDTPLIKKIEGSKELMQKALQWQTRRHFVEVQMQTWFKLTQNSAKYRDFGEDFVEKMIQDYTHAAIRICTSWAYQWDYVKKNRKKTIYWCRRGLALFEDNENLNKQFEFENNYLRFMLGRNLFEQKQYESAVAVLKECEHLHFSKRARFFRSVCLFKLGRYEEALAGFESLGRFNIDGSAVEWAQKTRERLQTVQKISYNKGADTWIQPEIPLPGNYISALALDGEDIWIGTIHPAATLFGEGHNLVMLEKDPQSLQTAKQTGGLVRYNIRTKHSTRFEVGKGISASWITAIQVQNGCVWVGTYGEGLDIYDKETKTWSNLSEEEGLPSNYIQCLDSDDTYLWIGMGRYGKGAIARLNPKTDDIHTFLPRDFPPQSSPPICYVSDIEVVGDSIWCALGRNGAAIYDKQKNLWTIHPQEFSFYSIETIAILNDRVWVGASEGNNSVFSCNLNGDDWKAISGKDSLPETSVFAMKTYNNRLLLGTYGLMIMDTEGNLVTYNLRSGQEWDFAVTEILPLSDQIWIGTREGIRILKIF